MRDINPPGHGGLILNISSAGGYSANPCLAFYSAGKFGKRFMNHWVQRETNSLFLALEGFTEALRKEMVPSWNIRIMVIQPGGFSTSWADSSMVNYPAPAAYAAPDTPSSQFRAMLNDHKAGFTGNPARFAAAVMKLADIDGTQLPLRMQFGSDALGLVRNKALRTIDDGKKWADISHSTNNDGIDKDFILDQLAAANC
jgi:NAD(P)-dependent dehydrogenase (short-subunit alcohol dehydrogenase family)